MWVIEEHKFLRKRGRIGWYGEEKPNLLTQSITTINLLTMVYMFKEKLVIKQQFKNYNKTNKP